MIEGSDFWELGSFYGHCWRLADCKELSGIFSAHRRFFGLAGRQQRGAAATGAGKIPLVSNSLGRQVGRGVY